MSDSSQLPGRGQKENPKPTTAIRIELHPGEGKTPAGKSWQDGILTLEQQLRDIATAIVVAGEEQYRRAAVHSHEWRLKLRDDLIERRRKEREDAERKERERQAELQRKRVERLLDEAAALRHAEDIRLYVAQVQALTRKECSTTPEDAVANWANWALAQADRIDPVRRGAFLTDLETLEG